MDLSGSVDTAAFSVATLHGQDLHYRDTHPGLPTGDPGEPARPTVLLVHGLLGSRHHWDGVFDATGNVAADVRLIAPDLFGHGGSVKPRGDYSLGAQAAALRDLLDHLGIDRATLVGHSLGGGIALQFSYLFPERLDRLVLVSSGGLGREVSPFLKSAALPGAEYVLPVLASRWMQDRVAPLVRVLRAVGVGAGRETVEAFRGFSTLSDAMSRQAFLASVRGVIDTGGQSVSARDHLPQVPPTLIVWGAADRTIPVAHGISAADAIPGSRLEVFETAGHFPFLDEPHRFARILVAFVTPPDGTLVPWHPQTHSTQTQTARPLSTQTRTAPSPSPAPTPAASGPSTPGVA